MPPQTPLSTIIALARAGALDHAWYAFSAAGYAANDGDPAALTVKGRLLKDKALRARGEERRRLYLESAQAYRRSAELQPGTYPLINAATLSLLSGNRAQAEDIAGEVLERIEREPEEPETPYWRAATEAEALLLVGRRDDARAALDSAIEAAPRAWEDHASTLRQFILIHEALGVDPLSLAVLRPPKSLSWSGPFLLPDGRAEEEIKATVAELLASERIGFGFGALAAGTGIAIAEALLSSGAELHVVLPSDPESFARCFVDPFESGWRGRFDAALDAAESVHQVRPLQVAPGMELVELAQQVAAGAAALNAERLMSESRRLLVHASEERVPAIEAPGAHLLAVPAGARSIELAACASSASPIALLSISVGSASDEGFDGRLRELRQVLETSSRVAVAPHLSGDEIIVGFAGAAEAAEAARTVHACLRSRMPVRVAGHFGSIPLLRDPFLDTARPTERGAEIVVAIAQATPPDTVCVSLDLAAALAAGDDGPSCASWIGELQAFDGGSAIPLYALRPIISDD